MATSLNEFFCTVFSFKDTINTPSCPLLPSNSIIGDIFFSQQDVINKIGKLRPNSTPGPDGISLRFLKDHVDILSRPLLMIFNSSMRTGEVPKDWKEANITPIFKKGSKSSLESYRPVLLTSVPCKLMESIIREKLANHLLTNKLINSSQHGFRNKTSCTKNLLEFLEKITSIVDNGDPMDMVYLFFSKAFHKVPKLRLIEKMRAHSIDSKILDWIFDWLTDRQQCMVLNGSFSGWRCVESGVPQG